MSEPREVKILPMGKGTRLRLLLDESQPESSIDRWITEVVCDGGPDSDPLFVPAHWHKYHSEHMNVIEGRIKATIGGKARIVSAGEEIFIPARVAHNLEGFKGERLVARERADPPGDYKVLFFNDLLSGGQLSDFWHTMRTFYDGDAYPALPLYFRFFDVAFVTVFGGIAKLFLPAKSHEKLE